MKHFGLLFLVASSFVLAAPTKTPVALLVVDPEGNINFLGSTQNGKWQSADKAAKTLTLPKGKTQNYTLFGMIGPSRQASGSNPTSMGTPCEDTYTVALNPTPVKNQPNTWLLGTSSAIKAFPRGVTAINPTNPVYLAFMREHLATQGLPNAQVTRLARAWQVDLEGDGTLEVILAASNYSEGSLLYPPPVAQRGEYSAVIMRRVGKKGTETIDLGTQVQTKTQDLNAENRSLAELFDAPMVVDLNGDGRFEVLFYGAYYEGNSISVLAWNGTSFDEVLNAACGV